MNFIVFTRMFKKNFLKLKILGINHFLDGFIPTENLRFRETALTFRVAENQDDEVPRRLYNYDYPDMKINLGDFNLSIKGSSFADSEIMVLLGENGTGKTTLIRLLAGNLKPDGESKVAFFLKYFLYFFQIIFINRQISIRSA